MNYLIFSKHNYMTHLDFINKSSGVKVLKINDIPYNINCVVKREDRCQFVCKCGEQTEKSVRQILQATGFNCKTCTNINKHLKRKAIYWTDSSINRYFIISVILYNIKRSNKIGKWEMPIYNWFQINCSRWVGAIIKKSIKFQDLLEKYGQNTRRIKNAFDCDEKLILLLRTIYDNDGISGLTPNNLDERYASVYSTYIRKDPARYDVDKEHIIHIGASGKKSGVSGCPSYWVCDKLGLLSERKIYLNRLLFNQTNKELLEIIKGRRKYFKETKTQISNSDYTTEMRILSKRDSKTYNISFFRTMMEFKQKLYPTPDGKHILKSKSEMMFYNHLVKYGFNSIEYEPKLYKNKKWSCDWVITLYNGTKIAIEIWAHHINDSCTHKRKEQYIKRRRDKENEWNDIDITFYGIEWEDCQIDDKMTHFFENVLLLVINPEIIQPFCISIADDEQFYKEVRYIYNQHGYLSSELLGSSLLHRNTRYYGKTIDGLLDILGIDKGKNKAFVDKAFVEKLQQTRRTSSQQNAIEKIKGIIDKLIRDSSGKIRVNLEIVKLLCDGERFWYNNAFSDFDTMIEYINKEHPDFNLVVAEKDCDWSIRNIDGCYELYSKLYEDLIFHYNIYLSCDNKLYTIPFEFISTNGYKLGQQSQFAKQHHEHIPLEYLQKLDELGFVWDERAYKNQLLIKLIVDIKKQFVENNTPIKQITQKTKTIDIINNWLYTQYFPTIGTITSQMRQNRAYAESKKCLLDLKDNDINILCGFSHN
jgi:hypothetical protein